VDEPLHEQFGGAVLEALGSCAGGGDFGEAGFGGGKARLEFVKNPAADLGIGWHADLAAQIEGGKAGDQGRLFGTCVIHLGGVLCDLEIHAARVKHVVRAKSDGASFGDRSRFGAAGLLQEPFIYGRALFLFRE